MAPLMPLDPLPLPVTTDGEIVYLKQSKYEKQVFKSLIIQLT